MKFFYILLVASLTLFVGCSSDDNSSGSDDMMDDVALLYIKNVFKDGVLYDTYEFDDNNKVSKARIAIDINTVKYILFEYSNDRIIQRGYDDQDELLLIAESYTLSNNVDRLDWNWEGDSSGNEDYYIDTSYSEEPCGPIVQTRHSINDALYFTKQFEYSGANCNDTELLNYENFDDRKTVRTRDNKNNAREGTYKRRLNLSPLNNILSQTIYDENDVIQEFASYTSTFEYNNQEYPISEVRTFLNGTVENYIYEYY